MGVHWNNLNQPVTIDDDLTLGHVMIMLIVDSVIYLLVMWYVEAVFPGAVGVPNPPYFFVLVRFLLCHCKSVWELSSYYTLQPSYWCGTRQSDSIRESKVRDKDDEEIDRSEFFETEPVDIKAGIKVQGLTKVFKGKGGKKV